MLRVAQVSRQFESVYRGKPVVRMHVMVKPIGPVCNLNCAYCYYLSKQDLIANHGGQMSESVLESFIRQYIGSQNYKEVICSWQGGEPTLLGLDFFRKAIELQKKHTPSHMRCENDLQTNGILLDDEWCRFLKDNNFLVGLSIDGPRELHDRYRHDCKGDGSFDRVMNAARLLKRHGVNFATLSCVNRLTARHPLEIYSFLRDIVGSRRMQFIPIVEPKVFRATAPQHWKAGDMPVMGASAARPGTSDSVVEDWCVDPDDWGAFLCAVFDEWDKTGRGDIYVQYFETAVETWMGLFSSLCALAPMCGKCAVLERDGSLYACDHYVYPEFRLGNIMDRPLAELAFLPRQQQFGTDKETTLPRRCRECEYKFACFGECRKNRFLRTPQGEPGLNYLCAGWKRFFRHIDKPVQKIVRELGYAPQFGEGISFTRSLSR